MSYGMKLANFIYLRTCKQN